MRREGADIQSHTHTHRVLQTMSDESIAADLARSRRLLEDVLGERVRAVAYPVGKAPFYSTRVRDAVRSAGFDLGFSNRSGINQLTAFDALDAKRISIDPSFSDAYFAGVMALPALAYRGRA